MYLRIYLGYQKTRTDPFPTNVSMEWTWNNDEDDVDKMMMMVM